MKERILQFLKTENKSSAQFAEEINVQPSSISHILSGRNNPSLDFIIKMLEKYKFLSTEWLLFGKGDMYRDGEMQKLFNESLDLAVEASDKPGKLITEVKNKNDYSGTASTDPEVIKPSVEKIVWFFKDGSFKEYTPGRG
ncbi:MAG: helix-turn-helix transcriptional regulator [Bacteroidia bacterium]|nr:helix-turn-helix transcriptional regulator [Bacteroidia bacterium]